MLLRTDHNPDVLTCLANLSNDEVFTPPSLANQMLDMLPEEIWKDETVTFLDPASKSGVFLREITKRLIVGLKPKIPKLEDRIEHIFSKQIFGVSITELTALLSRRSVYCSKQVNGKYSLFSGSLSEEGNIKFEKIPHVWKSKKCIYCGASEVTFNRGDIFESHAYEFIHTNKPEEIFNMKFDVIVGNPPYQLNDGGGMGTSATPLYQKFVEQGKKLNPRYLTMIIPARWFSGGKGLNSFRESMLKDKRISTLVDYADSRECFPGVDIAGGVCYFLWEKNYSGKCRVVNFKKGKSTESIRHLNEFDSFIRDASAVDIVQNIQSKHKEFVDSIISSRNLFGLPSKIRTTNNGELTLISSEGEGKIRKSNVPSGHEFVDKWKVFISKASYDHGGQPDKDGKRRILSKVFIAGPNTVCTETYLVAGSFEDRQSAINFANYLRTRFARFLLGSILLTQNITKDKFKFVPALDWTESWDDKKLFQFFKLPENHIQLIQKTIKVMDYLNE